MQQSFGQQGQMQMMGQMQMQNVSAVSTRPFDAGVDLLALPRVLPGQSPPRSPSHPSVALSSLRRHPAALLIPRPTLRFTWCWIFAFAAAAVQTMEVPRVYILPEDFVGRVEHSL